MRSARYVESGTREEQVRASVSRLLPTKLQPPRQRPRLLERSQWVQRIEQGLWRPLTLITAPAGSGKSTLVSQWARASEARFAWLSLDSEDNRPERFIVYLVGALRRIRPGLGKGIEALLRQQGPVDLARLLAEHVVEPLCEEDEPFVLVLEDLHVLDSTPVLDALSWLLDHLPPSMHLIVTTRSAPGLPVARLRARGELTELTAAELRFDSREEAAFYNEVMEIGLSPEEISLLEARTEGWPAAAQLCAVSLRDAGNRRAFIEALETNIALGDFLLEEVFAHQPADVQSFLLSTSILSRLQPALCDAVAGGDHGEATLAQLERDHLLIIRLEGEGGWMRYHSLFGAWLSRRLEQERPGERARLHRRASLWLANEGFVDEAVEHAQASGDPELLADLVERWGTAMVCRSDLAKVERWLAALPDTIRDTRPWFGVLAGWCAALSNDPLRLASVPQLANRFRAAAQDDPELRAHLEVLEGIARRDLSDLPSALASTEALLEAVDPRWLVPRSVVSLNAGTLSMVMGDDDRALLHLTQAEQQGRAGGNVFVAMAAIAARASVEQSHGRLGDLERAVAQGFAYAAPEHADELGLTGHLLLAKATLHFERWSLDDAREAVEGAVRRIRLIRDPWVSAHALLARVASAQGDLETAERLVAEAVDVARETANPLAERWASAARARHDLLTGRTDLRAQWGGRLELACVRPTGEEHEWNRLRVELALRGGEDVEAALGILLDWTRRTGRLSEWIDWQVALSISRRADPDLAATTLEEAVEAARPERIRRPFAESSVSWTPLLHRLRPQPRAWLGELFGAPASRPAAARASAMGGGPRAPLVERPSERELEVLAQVAAGRTNAEIAKALFVSVATVKSHLHHLFGKLGARNRVEALRAARAHNLLNQPSNPTLDG